MVGWWDGGMVGLTGGVWGERGETGAWESTAYNIKTTPHTQHKTQVDTSTSAACHVCSVPALALALALCPSTKEWSDEQRQYQTDNATRTYYRGIVTGVMTRTRAKARTLATDQINTKAAAKQSKANKQTKQYKFTKNKNSHTRYRIEKKTLENKQGERRGKNKQNTQKKTHKNKFQLCIDDKILISCC